MYEGVRGYNEKQQKLIWNINWKSMLANNATSNQNIEKENNNNTETTLKSKNLILVFVFIWMSTLRIIYRRIGFEKFYKWVIENKLEMSRQERNKSRSGFAWLFSMLIS